MTSSRDALLLWAVQTSVKMFFWIPGPGPFGV
jgi:hypothetical protein